MFPMGAKLCQLIDDPDTAAWTPVGTSVGRKHPARRADLLARPRAERHASPQRRAARAARRTIVADVGRLRVADARRGSRPRRHRGRGGAERASGDAGLSADHAAARASTPWTAAASATACRPQLASRSARPGVRVIGLIGDGSSMYSIQALWSAAQLKLPITFVILNNRRYAALQEFAPVFGFRRDDAVQGTDLPASGFRLARARHGLRRRARDRGRRAARRTGAGACRTHAPCWSRSWWPDRSAIDQPHQNKGGNR